MGYLYLFCSKSRLPQPSAQRAVHVSSRRVTEECCFILQDIEMIAVGESQKHGYIHPETLFLMEMRALRPIDFVIRTSRLEYAVFSSVIFVEYPFERCNQPSGWEGSQAEHAASCSCHCFKAEHISLIQIHDHISFMALQL